MGIIERQSKSNLLILIFAVFFGALNNIVLFPIALSKEEWGIIRFLPTIAIVVSNIALFGAPQILIKYMPYFEKNDKSNNGLLFFCLKIAGIGMIILLFLLIFFKSNVLGLYEKNASRLGEYYNYLIPLIVLTVLTELISAFSRALLLSVFQLFLKEILHRIIQSVILLLVLVRMIDFDQFVLFYSFSLIFNLIFLLFFLKSRKLLDVSYQKIDSDRNKEMMSFGGANFLTGLGATLTGRMDSLMIAALVSGVVVAAANGGLEAVAIYSFGAYIITIVEMPARAISNISSGIVAKAWEENDIDELSMIYKKTSINQLLIGGLLFILIWSGIDELFELIGGYHEAKWVVLFLGIGKMVVIASGAASSIIVGSKHYLYIMYGMIFLAGLTFLLNLLFIPKFGVVGAAIATMFALLVYYFLAILLLKKKFNLQPFTGKTVILIIIISLFLLFANYIDFGLRPIIEIVVMGVILSIVYTFTIYFLKISQDINSSIENIISKTFSILKT